MPAKGPRGRATIEVQFHKEACRACPMRTRCTRSQDSPRGLTLPVGEEHDALQQARQRQESIAFQRALGRRAGIEGAISQATVSRAMRRSGYVGLKQTPLHQVLTAASMNLTRVVAWWQGVPKAQTRRSLFAALAPT